jgi:hypothetical protein
VSAARYLAAFLLEALRHCERPSATLYPERAYYRSVADHYTDLCWELRCAAGGES